MIATVVFFASIALIAYAYIGYPAIVAALAHLRPRRVRRDQITPSVSLIVAAYNEERDIAAKLENALALDYPSERLEILVVSDGSTDGTDEIVRSYAERGVRLYRLPFRAGKTAAQNAAVERTKGEVIVFSDATTIYEPDALRKIVRSFVDPTVGCVAGRLVYVDRAESAVGRGCASYWNYETFIKRAESRFCSLIGVSGCLYAVRRSAYRPLDADMSSDFVIATEMRRRGLRTVLDEEAVGIEDTNRRGRDEFRMRVRVIEQTFEALLRYRDVLDPRLEAGYTFQMLSHKVARYAVGAALPALFVSTAVAAVESTFFTLALVAQIAFYGAALLGWAGDALGLRLGPLSFPYYFALANAAAVVGFAKFVRGESHALWDPIRYEDDDFAPARREPLSHEQLAERFTGEFMEEHAA